jgi:hypothetical protein
MLRSIRGALVALVVALLTLTSVAANAQDSTHTPQQSQFIVFADTAGIAPMPGVDSTYVTWVFALSTPTSYPSSGILVAWDCEQHKVKRLSHVVYQMKADSTGVEGPVVEDNGPWVEPVDPRLYALVCSIGPTHVLHEEDDATPPAHNDSPWFAPGKPRSEV